MFLSHSSKDKDKVRDLFTYLTAHDVDAWLDKEALIPGQDWRHEIEQAIQASDLVVVCLSRSSVDQVGFIQAEIRLALDLADRQPEGAIFIVPALLEPCDVPKRLRRLHWVDLFQAGGREKLLAAINSKRAPPPPEPAASNLPATAVAFGGPTRIDPHTRLAIAVGDGTSFSAELRQVATEAGYAVTESTFSSLSALSAPPALLMIVRGEQFEDPYDMLLRTNLASFEPWMFAGMILFCTSFVCWETRNSPVARSLLPFSSPDGTFFEDTSLVCRSGGAPDDDPFQVKLAYERLVANPGTDVLVEAEDGTPILGWRRCGAGGAIYLNACQHSCSGSAVSPLRAAPLRAAVRQLLRRLHPSFADRKSASLHVFRR